MRRILPLLFVVVFTHSAAYADLAPYFVLDQGNLDTGFEMQNNSPENDTRTFAQSFVPSQDKISAVRSFLYLSGSGAITVEIRSDSLGFPSSTVLASSTTHVERTPFYNGILFDPPVAVVPGETYYIVSYRTPGHTTYVGYTCTNDGSTYPTGQAYYKQGGGGWTIGVPYPGYENGDYIFATYYTAYTERPIAEAGEDQLGDANEAITLDGSGSSDPDGAIVTYAWKRLPDNATLSSGPDPFSVTAALGRVEEVIELTVIDDRGGTASDTMSIFNRRVENHIQNEPPQVNAGSDQSITLPNNVVTLNGSAIDDGLPNDNLIAEWTKIQGIGNVVFANSMSEVTNATFSQADTYVLRLLGDDGKLTGSDTVVITVNPQVPVNQAPQVDAGLDQEITLPDDTVSLNGSVIDDNLVNPNPTITWSKQSGSGSVVFGNSSLSVTTATFSLPDTYILRLEAYDGEFTISNDTTVTINAAVGVPGFQQADDANGIVSIEAEHFHSNTPQGGHQWSAVTTPAGFSGGGAMKATPDNDTNINTGYVANSPRLDFQINFVKTGTHYVWLRGFGESGSDDSVHAGLDGQAVANADRIGSFPWGWNWLKKTMDGGGTPARIEVSALGQHTLNIWMREDGFVVDKIVVTSNASYTPTGVGPAESPQV